MSAVRIAVFANGLLSRQLPVHLAHMEVLVHDTTSSIGTTYTSSKVSADGDSNSLSSLRTKRAVESLTYLYRYIDFPYSRASFLLVKSLTDPMIVSHQGY